MVCFVIFSLNFYPVVSLNIAHWTCNDVGSSAIVFPIVNNKKNMYTVVCDTIKAAPQGVARSLYLNDLKLV